MDVFNLRRSLLDDYAAYISSFITIKDNQIKQKVEQSINQGLLWPDPLIQLNPSFEPGKKIDELVEEGVLHKECKHIFRRKQSKEDSGHTLHLHKHQEDAIRIAKGGHNYVLTTGTGSGKSLAYIIPIVDYVLRNGSNKGVKAIIVYPMNALANSQLGELEKFLTYGYFGGKSPVSFERYTGQESDQEKNRILANPPDILLTNYVMLELILTRKKDRDVLVNAAQDLRFLVLDEMHTYRGRQGADVALLVRRVRTALHAKNLQCIGTSATIAASGGLDQQRSAVARVASTLFGDVVNKESVIGETLRRATKEFSPADLDYLTKLKESIEYLQIPQNFEDFKEHPLASWVESNLGLTTDSESGMLRRAFPRSISGETGAAQQLSNLTGAPYEKCTVALQTILLNGYSILNPDTGFPAFAFRLHQFINRGDTVYASLEDETQRHITVYGQQYVPGGREKVLLPLAFCRECGQEYYSVRRVRDKESGAEVFIPRELHDIRDVDDEKGDAGFLYLNQQNPWPENYQQALDRIPEDFLQENKGQVVIKKGQSKNIPEVLFINPLGEVSQTGTRMAYVKAPFRFCLNCLVTYNSQQTSDFGKLSELSSGGRSTDTTILSMSMIRHLREDTSLLPKAKKLLSFTDNRQDASLQAGHFNDFIEITLLRSAIYRAVKECEPHGITHDNLTMKVFEALNLPIVYYASDPDVRFAQKNETERALRELLGYRIYRDLKRGWRVTSPNLEQSGLLSIDYVSMSDLCKEEEIWEKTHPALRTATPEIRATISKVLLDFMRRELAIKVSYLDPNAQESLVQLSSQRLISPWAFEEREKLVHSSILFPRPKLGDHEDYGGNIYLSPRGGYGRYLRRKDTFLGYPEDLTTEEIQTIIEQLLENLRIAGLVEKVVDEKDDSGEKPGFQLLASGMIWKTGDGKQAYHDPIRVPRASVIGSKTNDFFVNFYQTKDLGIFGIEAREHTAQVPADQRVEREDKFRKGELPIMFCSPTMELGVDISELNAVNMRNVPPTPANYAQRSGRAGRSGQPALVFTYCTLGSPHDQYYFKRPDLMVFGAVSTPRIDLTNEDLIRSHVHAIWLADSGISLGASLKDVLDLSQLEKLPILDQIQVGINSQSARLKAKQNSLLVLQDLGGELSKTGWWNDAWLENVFAQIELDFNQACSRWRNLYQAAMNQLDVQHKIIRDASRLAKDKRQAQRLYQEANNQLALLTDSESIMQSDFYPYRYFASEGFLPGYSFPRLPLTAYIPARRVRRQFDEFLSRPRFLAISEFGPRAIIYHEGSRYSIDRVTLPVSDSGDGFATVRVKHCPVCGYLHPITSGDGLDRCERCNALLDNIIDNLFRLQNVSTRRRDRISSDEEERQRQGFELRTSIRFTDHAGTISASTSEIQYQGEKIGKLTYGHAASIWRMNLGWRRRKNPGQFGFMLDIVHGYWEKKDKDDSKSHNEDDEPVMEKKMRVVPFVEDHKNCLLFEPASNMSIEQMASLQAALKNAIQVEYQLEDSELSAEPLPALDIRRLVLFYEAAEGGAGVLRHLVEDPGAFQRVASKALEICHFDKLSGEDLRRGPNAKEDCEAACYDCLMGYYNQMDHRYLDRQTIKEFLIQCSRSTTTSSPQAYTRAEHYQRLWNLCQSELERDWLQMIEKGNYRLPSHSQYLLESCQTRPDFYYEKEHVAIYIDGLYHLYSDRQLRDSKQMDCMEDLGYTVIRFAQKDDWTATLMRYPGIFGGF